MMPHADRSRGKVYPYELFGAATLTLCAISLATLCVHLTLHELHGEPCRQAERPAPVLPGALGGAFYQARVEAFARSLELPGPAAELLCHGTRCDAEATAVAVERTGGERGRALGGGLVALFLAYGYDPGGATPEARLGAFGGIGAATPLARALTPPSLAATARALGPLCARGVQPLCDDVRGAFFAARACAAGVYDAGGGVRARCPPESRGSRGAAAERGARPGAGGRRRAWSGPRATSRQSASSASSSRRRPTSGVAPPACFLSFSLISCYRES